MSLSKPFKNHDVKDGFKVSMSSGSLPLKWELSRNMSASVCICIDGEAKVEVDMVKYGLKKNTILLLFPSQITRIESIDPDFRVMYFAFSYNVLDEVLFRFPPEFLTFLTSHVIYEDSPENIRKEWNKFEAIKLVYEDQENVCRREILLNLIRAYYLQLYNDIYKYLIRNPIKKTRKTEIYELFVKYVTQDYKNYREVMFYANKLGISAKYLSMVIMEMTGKNAKKWIDDYVVSEIKIRLHSSNESINSIALDLNFPDQSFLNKFFKRQTGTNPSHYRKIVL